MGFREAQKRNVILLRMVRFTVFVLTVIGIISAVNQAMQPKYVYTLGEDGSSLGDIPTTNGWSTFYNLEENSIDVLLLGSSNMGTGINPMDLYETAHIRAYNLASDSQPIWLSYFILKEVLKYHSPEAVVLDCYFLFEYENGNVSYPASKVLESMRWSTLKWEAIQIACEMDDTRSPLSYFFTNIQYHERWNELEEYDFMWSAEKINHKGLGFYCFTDMCGDDTYVPIRSEDTAALEPAEFDATAVEYLDKITELCNSEGIALILIKTPTHYQTAERHAAIQNYADEHGLEFYDFNSEELYEEIGFEYSQDMSDSSVEDLMNAHANIGGARKMSVWLARKLQEEFQVESQEDKQWEDSLEVNEMIWNMFELQHEDSLSEYLTILQKDYDTVFITIKSEAGISLSEEEIITLNSLGFSYSSREGVAWFGVREQGKAVQSEAGYVTCSGTIRDGLVSYSVLMEDASPGTGNITLGNEVYSQEESGIHIVVYSDGFHEVVDEVLFTYADREWIAVR